MKNTVFTVMTVLLMLLLLATIAPMQTAAFEIRKIGEPGADPPPPPRWELMRPFSGPGTAEVTRVHDISFQGNHEIFYGRGSQLIKWKFLERKFRTLEWPDPFIPFSPNRNQVTSVHVPRNSESIVIHGVGDRLQIRNADDLSLISSQDLLSGSNIYDLDTNLQVDYVVGRCAGSPNRYFTFEIWLNNRWGLWWDDIMDSPHVLAAAIHPDLFEDRPLTYYCFADDPDKILTRGGRHQWATLSYTTGWAATTAVRKIAVRRKVQGATRIAGLLEDNRIDVWDWDGNRLFTFNQDGTRNLYLEQHQVRQGLLEFTPNGELLATATSREVIFWDMSQRAKDPSSFTTDVPSDSYITAIAISDNGKFLAVGESKGDIYLYRWTGGNAPAAPAQEAETQPTALLSNYPNPFNPETWIPYQLSEAAEVTVTIHASDGKLVRTLELGQMPAGAYSDKDRAAYWDGRNAQGEPVASGVYFYTLQAGDFSATRKMVIRK